LGPSLRRLVIAILALAILLWATIPAAISRLTDPSAIDQVALTGPRGPQCLRLILAGDVSGSMTQYAAAEQAAVNQFLTWAPTNLRPDDEIGVLSFAGSIAWNRRPAPANASTMTTGTPANMSDGTALSPVINGIGSLPASGCRTALALLSDGQMQDLPAPQDARAMQVAAGIDDLSLLVPSAGIDRPTDWNTTFPAAMGTVFDGTDPNATGLTFAHLVARLTEQTLRKL